MQLSSLSRRPAAVTFTIAPRRPTTRLCPVRCGPPRDPDDAAEAPSSGRRRRLLQSLGAAGAGAVLSRLGLEPPVCRQQRMLPRLPPPQDREERLIIALQAQAYAWNDCATLVRELWSPDATYMSPLWQADNREALLRGWGRLNAAGQVTQVFVDRGSVDVVGTRAHALATLHYEPKVGPRVTVEFSTRVEFDELGRISRRRDFWDTASALRHAVLHG